jgi:predicted phage baseplate assembly protein
LRGELHDLPGTVGDEIVVLDEIFHEDGFTTLRFGTGLAQSYVRRTVTLNANVVVATHGETVPSEVLGGGDGTIPNQRFALKRPPLTHVSAPTPSGSESTLELRVDGVLWEQAPALYGLGARDRRYLLRAEHDGTSSVIFGDGRRGARPPSGTENVVATYRTGIGTPGMVGAERLTLMLTRPLGVTSVTNPRAAGGAAEPEARDTARQNAPRTLTTMERIVSLRDFEDFARGFAGIGKTQAVELWRGSTQFVHLTVAAEGGEVIAATSQLMTNLLAAIDRVRDPGVKLVVESFERRYFDVEAELVIDPAHMPPAVVEAAQARLADFFSFEQRAFGQAATAAEVITRLQTVPGVIAVDLNVLRPVADPGPPLVVPVLLARQARVDGAATRPAELLLLSPAITQLSYRAP